MWHHSRIISLKVARKLPYFILLNKTCDTILKRWLLKWITKKKTMLFSDAISILLETKKTVMTVVAKVFTLIYLWNVACTVDMFEPENEKQGSLASELF